MAVGTVRFFSAALGRPVPYTIVLPEVREVGPGPYPALLQLHGRHDDYAAWVVKSRLALYLERLPLITVLPDGGNFWWSNVDPALRYEDLLVTDLWEHVNAVYATRPGAPWAIGGLSMGGYGALRLGLKYPEKYCSVFAHSSVIPPAAILRERQPELSPEQVSDMDCYRWAAEIDPARAPRLGFDCGTEDSLLDQNRSFHDYLTAVGLPHSYAEHPGGHTWDYWDQHVQTALRQHAEVLGIAPVPPPGP
jgi:putative tributyrin esterase